MYKYITQTILCIISLSSLILGAPYKDRDKKPDIEDFIDRLLTSDKFEKLADKIAEKAADKIITIQQAHDHDDKKTDETRPRVDSKEHKHDDIEPKKSEVNKHKLDKGPKTSKESNKKEGKEKKGKAKIDTVAAIQKFASFPVEELSLNYKHFTTKNSDRAVPKFTSVMKKYKNTEDDYEDRSTKKRDEKKSKKHDDMYKRVHQGKPDDSSDSSIEKKESDLSIDALMSKDEEEEELKAMDGKKGIDATSDSEEDKENPQIVVKAKDDDKDEESNEDVTTTAATKSTKVTKKALKKASKNPEPGKVNRSHDAKKKETSSEESSSHEDASTSTTTKPTARLRAEKSSDSESDDNKVAIADTEKHDAKDPDLRHAVREEDGKLYAFAQSPDYDEYHEQLSRMLKHVQNKNEKDVQMDNNKKENIHF